MAELSLTSEEILKARDWMVECADCLIWRDIRDSDDVRQLTDEEVVKGIRKHYGIQEFKRDCEDWDVYGKWERP